MCSKLDKFEKHIQTLVEDITFNFFSFVEIPHQLNKKLVQIVRSNSWENKYGLTFAPTSYKLLVHPTHLPSETSLTKIGNSISKILLEAGNEAGITFNGDIDVRIASKASIPLGEVEVEVLASNFELGETKGMLIEDSQEGPKSPYPSVAFFIVDESSVFPLSEKITNIGRSDHNEMVIKNPTISRHHAQIRKVRGRFIIFDLDSTFGIYVNEEKINKKVLTPGDVISLGEISIVYGEEENQPGGTTKPMNMD